jgi:DNA-binding MarR family transcriptional regulator
MNQLHGTISNDQQKILELLGEAAQIERRIDRSLSSIKGISFSEYQILRTLLCEPGQSASRVDLAEAVDLTPSAVTRALKPLEKLGFVETIKSARDARQALATLTDQGRELCVDAVGVVNDLAADLVRS